MRANTLLVGMIGCGIETKYLLMWKWNGISENECWPGALIQVLGLKLVDRSGKYHEKITGFDVCRVTIGLCKFN